MNKFSQDEDNKLISLLLNDKQVINEKFVLNDLAKSADIKKLLYFWQIIYDSELVYFNSDFSRDYLSKISLLVNQISNVQQKNLITLLLDNNRKISIYFILNDLTRSENISDSIYFWQKLFKSDLINFYQDFQYQYLIDLEIYISRLTKDDKTTFIKFVSDYPNLLEEKDTLNSIVNSSNVPKAINYWKNNHTFWRKIFIPIKGVITGEIPLKLISNNYGITFSYLLTIIILIIVIIFIVIFYLLRKINYINLLKSALSKINRKEDK